MNWGMGNAGNGVAVCAPVGRSSVAVDATDGTLVRLGAPARIEPATPAFGVLLAHSVPLQINALRNSQSAKPRPIKLMQGHASLLKLYFHCIAFAAHFTHFPARTRIPRRFSIFGVAAAVACSCLPRSRRMARHSRSTIAPTLLATVAA
jgi:hypothetical protein